MTARPDVGPDPSIKCVPAGRHQIIKDSTQYLLATIVAQAVGLVRSLAIPVLFSPAQLGIWNLMIVIINYGEKAHLGLLDGMNRAIPMLRSRGERVEIMKDSVFWLNLLLGALAGLAMWVASWFAPADYTPSLHIIAVIVLLQLVFAYLFSLLRADGRFGLVSQGVAVLSISSTVLILVFALSFEDHLFGALIGLAGAHGLVVAYWFAKGGYRFPFRMNPRSVRRALVLGVPVKLLGVLDILFMSVDRWMIVANFGETTLGYYALGLMVSSLLYVVPGAVASVVYARMLERFAVAQDPRALRGLLLGPLRILAALMVMATGGAVLGLPLLIRLFLPRYLPSIPMIEILVPGAFFLSLGLMTGTYLTAIDRQWVMMVVQIAATIFSLVANSLVVQAGYDVTAIAVVTVVAYVGIGLGYTTAAVYLALGRGSGAVAFLARLLGPFVAMVAAVAVAAWLTRGVTKPLEDVLSTTGSFLMMSVVVVPVLWLVNRDGELLGVARAELLAWRAARNGRG